MSQAIWDVGESEIAGPPCFDACATESNGRTRLIIRLLRAYIRYAPMAIGKTWLWSRVIDPHFAWNHHHFNCRTKFAGRIAGDTADILQQYLYYFGVWEPNLTAWIMDRLQPGDTFVDIGANIGYYSLLALRQVGQTGSVVACEASPTIFRQLEDNLRLNRAPSVRTLNVAVADREGSASVYRGPDANGGLSTIISDEAAANDCRFEAKIATAPLSQLLTSHEIATTRLIKIDVEGAEWAVATGMTELFSALRPDVEIIVEMCPQRLARQGISTAALLSLFGSAGFQGYTIANDYAAESYLTCRAPQPPTRLRTVIEHEVDVVFSRIDAEVL